jgi:hypothetical protein
MSTDGVAAQVKLELSTLDLGQAAGISRLKNVLSDRSAKPSASITGAVGKGRAAVASCIL